MRMTLTFPARTLFTVGSFVAFLGCSAGGGASGRPSGLDGSGGSGGANGSGSDTSSGGTSGTDTGGQNFGGSIINVPDTDSGVPSGCTGASIGAESIPVDVFMMVDQSLSMTAPDPSGGTRWSGIVGALTQFVSAKESAGIGVGVQYFGLGLGGLSCTIDDYAKAEVEIAPLPQNQVPIVNSLNAHGPSTVTPTMPALAGAIQHARAWKLAHSTHQVVVLLVTDGEPDTCGTGADPTQDIVNVATDGVTAAANKPSIQTFVLGVGDALDALNKVAAAGGPKQAYLVTGSSGVAAAVTAQLNSIRKATTIPCQFTLPTPDPGTTFDSSKVNVYYTPQGSPKQLVYYESDSSKCGTTNTPAWQYDNIQNPTKIELCKSTCDTVTAGGGQIEYVLHCPTTPAPIPIDRERLTDSDGNQARAPSRCTTAPIPGSLRLICTTGTARRCNSRRKPCEPRIARCRAPPWFHNTPPRPGNLPDRRTRPPWTRTSFGTRSEPRRRWWSSFCSKICRRDNHAVLSQSFLAAAVAGRSARGTCVGGG